jgi:hypothetical protein
MSHRFCGRWPSTKERLGNLEIKKSPAFAEDLAVREGLEPPQGD